MRSSGVKWDEWGSRGEEGKGGTDANGGKCKFVNGTREGEDEVRRRGSGAGSATYRRSRRKSDQSPDGVVWRGEVRWGGLVWAGPSKGSTTPVGGEEGKRERCDVVRSVLFSPFALHCCPRCRF